MYILYIHVHVHMYSKIHIYTCTCMYDDVLVKFLENRKPKTHAFNNYTWIKGARGSTSCELITCYLTTELLKY